MPRIARPPEMWSSVVAILAVSAGSRNVFAPTISPIRIRSVAWAQAASVSQPSRIGPVRAADDRVQVVPRPERVEAEAVGAPAGLEQRRPRRVLVPAQGAEADVGHAGPPGLISIWSSWLRVAVAPRYHAAMTRRARSERALATIVAIEAIAIGFALAGCIGQVSAHPMGHPAGDAGHGRRAQRDMSTSS